MYLLFFPTEAMNCHDRSAVRRNEMNTGKECIAAPRSAAEDEAPATKKTKPPKQAGSAKRRLANRKGTEPTRRPSSSG